MSIRSPYIIHAELLYMKLEEGPTIPSPCSVKIKPEIKRSAPKKNDRPDKTPLLFGTRY